MFISIDMYAMFTHAWLEYKYWIAKLVLRKLYHNTKIYVSKTFPIFDTIQVKPNYIFCIFIFCYLLAFERFEGNKREIIISVCSSKKIKIKVMIDHHVMFWTSSFTLTSKQLWTEYIFKYIYVLHVQFDKSRKWKAHFFVFKCNF